MNLIEEEGSVNPIGQEDLNDFFEYSEDIIDKQTILPMTEALLTVYCGII